MDSRQNHRVNLVNYRRHEGGWQFFPVIKRDGKPAPRFIIVVSDPVSSKGGKFYLDWREDGKRKRQPCGTTPREALDAWHPKRGFSPM